MCGLAGIVSEGGEKIVPVLQFLTRAMVHRGPDGEGMEVIPAGRQPMQDPECGNRIIFFNGEIFNSQRSGSPEPEPGEGGICASMGAETTLHLQHLKKARK